MAIVVVGGLAVASAVGGPKSSPVRSSSATRSTRVAGASLSTRNAGLAADLASAVQFSPPSGTAGTALDQTVAVTATQGRLLAVRASTAAGQPLGGTVSASGARWTSPGPLVPGATYRLTATVAGHGGVTAQSTSTFTTLTPTRMVTADISPESGSTVGVGEPISIVFDRSVPHAARAAVLSHLAVSMSHVVPGGWHWFSSHELHFRPEAYWPSGDRVTVTADLAGWDVGEGMWGAGLTKVHFTIGADNVATADLATEHMTVTSNGKVVWVLPISAGRTQYPTMDGVHITLDKEPVVHMVSSTVGIPVTSVDGYDEYVHNDVRISDSGEYVHAAPWSVGAQGVVNVSHGCINLSDQYSSLFYGFSQMGDVVNVVNGPRPPAFGDHGVMDWTTPWSDWAPATVTAVPA